MEKVKSSLTGNDAFEITQFAVMTEFAGIFQSNTGMGENIPDWLQYDAEEESVICLACTGMVERSLPISSSVQNRSSKKAFVNNEYHTWFNGPSSFRSHQDSALNNTCLSLIQDA
ncbi:hypothetical protein QAD02_014081 [Eretmocerus hayati]|uniref:Uncharacterized protein n=1 Tax=Eretmocerus hayati TaxID=131215 RepID=A0ACC2P3X2_9HYME|nr:hypothetical protein QAD02_014081 [Eretmocerus hayati]